MDLLSFFQRLQQAGNQQKLADMQTQIGLAQGRQQLGSLDAQAKLAGGYSPLTNTTYAAPQDLSVGNTPQGSLMASLVKDQGPMPAIMGNAPKPQGILYSSPQDYDAGKMNLLRQAMPTDFIKNDANMAMLNQRLGALGSGDNGAPPAGMPASYKALLALDPSGGKLAEVIAKMAEPTTQQKLIDYGNSLQPGDPRKLVVDNLLKHEQGYQIDPNEIEKTKAQTAEANASTIEKGAQTDLARTRTKLLDSTQLSDDTLERAYQGLLAGQKISDIVPNIGRGTQGAQQMTALQNYFTKRMTDDGVSQAGIAARMVNLKAQTAAAQVAAKRGANVDMGAIELETFAQQAEDALAKIDNKSFKPWNAIANLGADQFSDPNLAAYKTALQGVRGAYASVIARGGVPSVDAMHKADDLLNSAQGPGAVKAIIGQMKNEAAGVKSSSSQVQQGIQNAVTSGPAAQPAQAPAAVSAPSSKAPSPPAPSLRKANMVYSTPKGDMKWTGTGWVQP